MDLDLKTQLVAGRGTAVRDAASALRREPSRNPALPAESASFPRPAAARAAEEPGEEIVPTILSHLEQHPHFRGRTSLLGVELADGAIILTGRVPSYYLKQLLQEAIMAIPGIERAEIDNRVVALYPHR